MIQETCSMCGRPADDHRGVRHMFVPPGQPVDTSQFARKRPNDDERGNVPGDVTKMHIDALKTPFDPVLRLALIDAGVITPEQLDAAQRKMALFTQQVTGGDDRQ